MSSSAQVGGGSPPVVGSPGRGGLGGVGGSKALVDEEEHRHQQHPHLHQRLPPTMKALTFQGQQKIQLSEVETPQIVHPTDVIVKVSLCGICGSDLHPYHGREAGIAPGTIVGHEFVGSIVEKGCDVSQLALGDRVMSPFTTCCGTCHYCAAGRTARCEHPHAHLFGWMEEEDAKKDPEHRKGLHGSQAQYVRVPLADSTLVKVPAGVTDGEALLLGDILSTAFFAAESGEVADGSSVVVVGCGPVGLLAVLAARWLGAAQVFAVDSVPYRLDRAKSLGATPFNFTSTDVPAAVRAATGGRGADVALEVVGSPSALRLAFDVLHPFGVLSSVGVHTQPSFPFSPVEGYNKNLTYRSGRCPARRYMERLIQVVEAKGSRGFDFEGAVVTHRLPLEDGVRGYHIFDNKEDGCIKVVLDPWA